MTIDMLLAYPRPSADSPICLTPLSILFPGAMFEQQGLTVAYYDERFDSEDLFVDLVKQSKEIGVSAFTGYQTGRAAALLEKAKQVNSSIVTGVGGHHARILPEQVLAEPFVDKVWKNRYYGEELFPYNERTRLHFERTTMQYFTSRGCPGLCTFCAVASPWEPKDIDEVDKELTTIHRDVKFKHVSFSDPNIASGVYQKDGLNYRLDRVERIKQIGRIVRRLGATWDGCMRASYMTPEMVNALEESGCVALELGCESGNDYFLQKVLKKGVSVNTIKWAARNMKGAGFSAVYSFMAYMPRETKSQLNDTLDLIDWIVDTDPHARVSIFKYAPYPGTLLYEDAVQGVDGYQKFEPPTTMKGWGSMPLMGGSLYWITGLCFRKDNTRKNFPGEDWALIEPYVQLAEKKWKSRELEGFPYEEVEQLIARQIEKRER